MAIKPATRDRRLIDRARRRIGVRYGAGKPEFLGFTSDFADTGLFLQGNNLFAPGTVLTLEVDLPGGRRMIRGTVRWVKEVPPAFRRSMRGGMGIETIPEA